MTTRTLRTRPRLVSAVLVCMMMGLSLSVAACNASTPPSVPPSAQYGTSPSVEPSGSIPTTPATTTPPPVAKTTVRIYLVRGEFLGVGMGRTATAESPAKTAMLQLLAGPNHTEKAMGLGTVIPKGTKLLGLSIKGGTANVNLSKQFESGGGTLSMTLRIAQVVNTLTQFEDVSRVAFRIEGKKVKSIGGEGIIVSPPVGRADFDGALPAIMLESPLPKATIGNPVRIKGSANVFEAQFRVRITDAAGKIVADKPVKATSGTGTRGSFNKRISYKSPKHGKGSITVYELSAEDGTEINVVKIPVSL